MPKTDFPDERFQKGSELFIEHPQLAEDCRLLLPRAKPIRILTCLKLKQYDHIKDVEKFKGGLLKVSSRHLRELPPGEYYYHEIIGCKVVTEEGEELGVIRKSCPRVPTMSGSSNGRQGKPVLIPYIDDVVKQVDVTEKRVTIHLMEGLI